MSNKLNERLKEQYKEQLIELVSEEEVNVLMLKHPKEFEAEFQEWLNLLETRL